jgi:ribosome recycling factor
MSSTSALEERMNKALEALQKEFSGLRTSRATPSLLDNLRLEVYGQTMPLSGVATVTVQDVRTLLVTVWDAGNTKAVDAAIRTSELSLNPRVDGNKLFVALPELTSERRADLVKIIKKKSEDMKVSMRNFRKEANDAVKLREKNKEISEDELKQQMDAIQKITDAFIEKVDSIATNKQKEITSI